MELVCFSNVMKSITSYNFATNQEHLIKACDNFISDFKIIIDSKDISIVSFKNFIFIQENLNDFDDFIFNLNFAFFTIAQENKYLFNY